MKRDYWKRNVGKGIYIYIVTEAWDEDCRLVETRLESVRAPATIRKHILC